MHARISQHAIPTSGAIEFEHPTLAPRGYHPGVVLETFRDLLFQHGGLQAHDYIAPPQDGKSVFYARLSNEFILCTQLLLNESSYSIQLNTISYDKNDGHGALSLLPGGSHDLQLSRRELFQKFVAEWGFARDAINLTYDNEPIDQHLTVGSLPSVIPIHRLDNYDETKLHFEDVAGYEEIKEQLLDLAILQEEPELAESIGLTKTQGILLYGVPGTGKTSLLKAFANEIDAKLVELSAPDIIEEWIGTSARNMDTFFTNLIQKDERIVVLMDDFDGLASSDEYATSSERSDVVDRLKKYVTTITRNWPNILLVGTTNNLYRVDEALIRPGRFKAIEMKAPDELERRAILSLMLGRVGARAYFNGEERPDLPRFELGEDIDVNELARESQGLVGAHFDTMVDGFRTHRLRFYRHYRFMPPLTHNELLEAIQKATGKQL